MAVIAHHGPWPHGICTECGTQDNNGRMCGECGSEKPVKWIDVVPADDLKGAVSAIREIAAEIRKIAEWEPEAVDRELQGLADRLDALGGQ